MCPVSANRGGRVCISVCLRMCASAAWGAQWRTHVGLAQAVTHTHLALCASHTDRFVLAHSIQVVRPGGKGRKDCVCVCASDYLGGGGGSWRWEITRFRVLQH